jgi:hypothetical protein
VAYSSLVPTAAGPIATLAPMLRGAPIPGLAWWEVISTSEGDTELNFWWYNGPPEQHCCCWCQNPQLSAHVSPQPSHLYFPYLSSGKPQLCYRVSKVRLYLSQWLWS